MTWEGELQSQTSPCQRKGEEQGKEREKEKEKEKKGAQFESLARIVRAMEKPEDEQAGLAALTMDTLCRQHTRFRRGHLA